VRPIKPTAETAVGAGVAVEARNGLDPSSSADIQITGGSPTPEEVAAVTAVLQASLAELAAEQELLDENGPSAWQRSQRQLRISLQPGRGAWRSFSG